MGRRGRWIKAAVGTALITLLAGRWLAVGAANRLWADALGVGAIHGEIHRIQTMLLATAFTAAAVWCMGNLYLVYRSIGSVHMPRQLGNIEIIEAVPRRYLLLGAAALGLVLAFTLSRSAGGWWYDRALAAMNIDLRISDPLLGRDVAYYLYQLPWQRTLHSFVTLLSGVMLAITALLYAALGAVRWERRRLQVADLARVHLGGLLAAFALALFWGYRLEPVEYVAGIHAVPLDTVLTRVRFPIARVLAALALLVAGASLLWLWSGRLAVLVVAWTTLGVGSFAGHYVIAPFAAAVRSAEELELPGLESRRAQFLSLGYGVSPRQIRIRPAAARDPSTIAGRAADLRTAPVWDGFAVTVLLDRLAQTEAHVRFSSASLAAYPTAGGTLVPVYLAARRIDLMAASEAGADLSWERVHGPAYGYRSGAAAVLAHRASDVGLALFVPELARPDSAVPEVTDLRLERTEVVFAPGMTDFVIVPRGDGWLAGVAAGGFWRRLALAWVLQSPHLVTSELVTDTSLVVWDRDVTDRLNRYAPFAEFGAAYPVVAGGKLYWLASGYVSAAAFPVTPPSTWGGRTAHYARSSLVGVVEASSGSTAVHLVRDPDPLTAGWAKLAPSLVRPAEELPISLAPHVRYPAELFETQLEVLSAMSMLRDDAGGSVGAARRAGIGLTEGAKPFWWLGRTPADSVARLRLVAALHSGDPPLLSGVADGTVRGGKPVLTLLRVESPVSIPGPAQVARGFPDVRREAPGMQGNLRTVPFSDGMLTLQASYRTPGDRQAPPRLSDVVVAWGGFMGRGATVEQAVQNVRRAAPGSSVAASSWDEARRWFERMDTARQIGDWEAFGRAYEELRRLLAGAGDSIP